MIQGGKAYILGATSAPDSLMGMQRRDKQALLFH